MTTRAARDSEASPDPSPAELVKEATMRRNQPEPDNEHPGRKTAPDEAAAANSAFDSAGLVRRRQLEKSVSWSGRERFRCLWYRLRLTIAEMNYASRRMVELQRQL